MEKVFCSPKEVTTRNSTLNAASRYDVRCPCLDPYTEPPANAGSLFNPYHALQRPWRWLQRRRKRCWSKRGRPVR